MGSIEQGGPHTLSPILTRASWVLTELDLRLDTSPNRSSYAVFSFLYLKKFKISKIYVRFGKFQKYTPVALWGRQGSNVIFFLQIYNKVPGGKKRGHVAPPTGARWGGGDRGPFPYLSPSRHSPPFPLSFEPKNSGKKIGVRRRKAAKLCRIAYS